MKPLNKVVIKDNRVVSTKLGGKGTKVGASTEAGKEQLAFTGTGGVQGGRNSVSVSTIGTGSVKYLDTLLSGFIDERNETQLRNIYRDIYYYDSVCGGAADMISTLPFSDFSLNGLDDKKLEVYQHAVDRLNLKTQFPSFALGYLVDAEYAGTLVMQDKSFTDILPHDIQDCNIEDMPFVSQDPLITVSKSEKLKNFLESEAEVIKRQRRNYPAKMLKALEENEFELDPLTTIYLARKGINGKPTSFFRRVLPWYLIEKTLLRGTIVEASKRQRSALHVAAGGDMWEPTPEELSAIVALFQQADFDPLGPTIATRNDIQINEIRQGGDFWKITDVIDTTNQLKMRALGISEAFLSGDVTYNTSEAALSVFIENIRTFRDYMTQQTFYRKMFPLIAHLNGFTKKKSETAQTLSFRINDTTSYDIPQVRWHKSLHPHSDRDTMEILNQMADKGIPVTLRMWAAAGGIDLDSVINELDQDKKIRARIKEKTADMDNDGMNDNAEIGEDNFSFAKLAPIRRIGMFGRDYGEAAEITGTTVTGKKKYIYNQKAANEKANWHIVQALSALNDPSHYIDTKKKIQSRLGRSRRVR